MKVIQGQIRIWTLKKSKLLPGRGKFPCSNFTVTKDISKKIERMSMLELGGLGFRTHEVHGPWDNKDLRRPLQCLEVGGSVRVLNPGCIFVSTRRLRVCCCVYGVLVFDPLEFGDPWFNKIRKFNRCLWHKWWKYFSMSHDVCSVNSPVRIRFKITFLKWVIFLRLLTRYNCKRKTEKNHEEEKMTLHQLSINGKIIFFLFLHNRFWKVIGFENKVMGRMNSQNICKSPQWE